MQTVQIISLIIALVFFGAVIDFIRRGLLKEKYAVLWLASTLAVAVLSVWKGLLDSVASVLGVAYPPSLLFLVAFLFVLFILFHFSVVLSVLTERNKVLTQEITLLKAAFKEKEDAPAGRRGEKGK
ncbi:MAG: DUF2304 domain-containing protein [Deltaproteobacteria bacterium]|nr:DUF2304 domain-containing protein [Deltaproteobacteria bacterium]